MILNQVRTRWGPHFRGFTTLARACSLRAHRTLPLCRPVTNSSEARVLITIDGSSVSQPRSGAVCMLAKTCFLHTKVDQMFVFRGFFYLSLGPCDTLFLFDFLCAFVLFLVYTLFRSRVTFHSWTLRPLSASCGCAAAGQAQLYNVSTIAFYTTRCISSFFTCRHLFDLSAPSLAITT